MAERQQFDAGDLADRLAALMDEELFALMQKLEDDSEHIAPEARSVSDLFARIAMVETTIADRFSGQRLAPYKEWQQGRMSLLP